MKKLSTIALAGLLLLSVGCKKDEEKGASVAGTESTATITGVIKAETDNTNASSEKQAGVTILAVFSREDLTLNPIAGQTYPNVTVVAVTDANGKYSLTIPTNAKIVHVTLKPQDFLSSVVTGPNTSNPDQLFTTASQMVNINEKETKIININY